MRKISLKLLTVILLTLLTVFFVSLVLHRQYLKPFYLNQKKQELNELVRSIQKGEKNQEQLLQEKPEFVLIFVDIDPVEESFNEGIRRKLWKNRMRLNRIWYVEAQMNEVFEGKVVQVIWDQPKQKHSFLASLFLIKEESKVLLIGTSLAHTTETIEIMEQFSFWVALAVFFLSAIPISFYSFKLTYPISQIQEKAARITSLDFTGDLKIKTHDELQQLAEYVNQMSQKLEGTLQHLQSANLLLQEDLERKEQVDRMRKEFIANVSHELKSPLTLVEGYAQALKDRIDEKSRDYFCDVILDESGKMTAMIEELLELASLESQNQKFSLSSVNFHDLFQQEVKKHQAMLIEKLLDVTYEFSPSIDSSWWAEAEDKQIVRVIRNLLLNAFAYSPDCGEVIITMKKEKEKEIMWIRIANETMDPIEDHLLEEIWKPFVRLDHSGNKKYGGTGLGLAIVAEILKKHQSDFGVENTEKGVRFYFSLPLTHN